jgi:tetratricopeptide (TPR) repeat protein
MRPDAGVITPWRRPEVDELLEWCLDRPVSLLRLVHGVGGQGKTQLAGQVCAELRQRGWLAGFVELPAPGSGQVPAAGRGAGTPAPAWSRRQSEIVTAVRALPRLGVPALLVVDYAENHAASVGALLREAVRAATAPTASPPLRILLLSRGELDWLDEHPCRDWVHPEPLLLGPLPGSLREPGGDLAGGDVAEVTAQVWTRAVTELAERAVLAGLLRTAPEPAALALDPATDLPTTLDLYAQALLRVLDHARQTGDPAGAEVARSYPDPVSGVLAHERRVVAHALAAAGVELGGPERDLAVCVAYLRPAADTASAVDALAASPRLRALPAAQLDRVVGVLARLFPPASGETVWQAPGPDRLADTHLLHVAQAARSDKDFLDHVAAVCAGDDRQLAGHAARVLLRALSTPGAAARYPAGLGRVEHSIIALLRAHPDGYAPVLVALAPGRFEDAILDVVDERRTPAGSRGLSIESVADIDSDLGRVGVTTSRLRIAVAVSQRLVDATRPAGAASDPAAVARHADHLVGLSRRLAEAGVPGEAVEPAREAVEWYRPLFGSDPGTYRQGLAAAVTNLGSRLADGGAPAAALAAAEEAVALRRELAETGSREHQVDLAAALHNLGLRLRDVGEVDRAAAPAQEAVTLLRALAVGACHFFRVSHG